MSFFTFRVRTPDISQLDQQEMEIVELSGAVAKKGVITFEQEWVKELLKLFRSKEEIHMFWQVFSQTFLRQQRSSSNGGTTNINSNINQPAQTLKHELMDRSPSFDQSKPSKQNALQDLNIHKAFRDQYLNSFEKQCILQPKLKGFGSKWTKPSSIPPETLNKVRNQYFFCKKNNNKFNVKHYAEFLNVTRTTVYRMINKWQGEVLYEGYINNHLKYHRSNKFTDEHQRMVWTKNIEEIVKNNPKLPVLQIRNMLEQRGCTTLPNFQTIHRILFALNKASQVKQNRTKMMKLSNSTAAKLQQ